MNGFAVNGGNVNGSARPTSGGSMNGVNGGDTEMHGGMNGTNGHAVPAPGVDVDLSADAGEAVIPISWQ